MASYVVMLPASDEMRAERAIFVRDGFSVVAFLVPLLWLAWRRLWTEALLVVAAGALIMAAATAGGFGAGPVIVLSLLVNLFVGLEGNSRRIARLRRGGWVEDAVVWAPALDEAEARYFAGAPGWDPQRPHSPLPPRDLLSSGSVHSSDRSLVGLVGHREVG